MSCLPRKQWPVHSLKWLKKLKVKYEILSLYMQLLMVVFC